MRNRNIALAALASFFGCEPTEVPEPPSPTVAAELVVRPEVAVTSPPAPAKKDGEKTVLDVAIGSPDHTTLGAAVKAAGLAPALGSPGGIYTVFAPTNAAFDKLPQGTVESLLEPGNQAKLRGIIQHHASVPILLTQDMRDGQVLGMADGKKLILHVSGDRVKAGEANVIASVPALNGVVHVVDAVILPGE